MSEKDEKKAEFRAFVHGEMATRDYVPSSLGMIAAAEQEGLITGGITRKVAYKVIEAEQKAMAAEPMRYAAVLAPSAPVGQFALLSQIVQPVASLGVPVVTSGATTVVYVPASTVLVKDGTLIIPAAARP